MMAARKKKAAALKTVDDSLLRSAFAAAVATGDIVNFRLLFGSFSPGRQESSEQFDDPKYGYLQPSDALRETQAFREAEAAVSDSETWAYIKSELSAKRPAQLPAELLTALSDNALRAGKFTSAAQGYETLRIRRRVQALLFEESKEALDNRDFDGAARGFRAGAALSFDYSAFPEPLPRVPDYPKRALMVHGRYPRSPEESVSLLPASDHANALIMYLLDEPEAITWFRDLPLDLRVGLATALVRLVDPSWNSFSLHYREACQKTEALSAALIKQAEQGAAESLQEEIAEQQAGRPEAIMEHLLGRSLDDGPWWEYLKALAYDHPASIFFISRQLIGDREVLLPRLRSDSELPAALGLTLDR